MKSIFLFLLFLGCIPSKPPSTYTFIGERLYNLERLPSGYQPIETTLHITPSLVQLSYNGIIHSFSVINKPVSMSENGEINAQLRMNGRHYRIKVTTKSAIIYRSFTDKYSRHREKKWLWIDGLRLVKQEEVKVVVA